MSYVYFRCVHLIAELSHNQELHTTVSDLLPLLAKAASLHHYNHHVNFLETVCKQVSYMYYMSDSDVFLLLFILCLISLWNQGQESSYSGKTQEKNCSMNPIF